MSLNSGLFTHTKVQASGWLLLLKKKNDHTRTACTDGLLTSKWPLGDIDAIKRLGVRKVFKGIAHVLDQAGWPLDPFHFFFSFPFSQLSLLFTSLHLLLQFLYPVKIKSKIVQNNFLILYEESYLMRTTSIVPRVKMIRGLRDFSCRVIVIFWKCE